MFRKIVAIEPVSLVKEAEEELRTYAEEAVFMGISRRMTKRSCAASGMRTGCW